MPRSLEERLQRLGSRARHPRPGEDSDLERLEERLVGGVRSDLALKARLERLVAVAERSGRRGGREDFGEPEPGTRVEELVQGCRVENDRGEFFLIDEALPLEGFHGGYSLSRFRLLTPESVGIVAGEEGFGDFDLREAVFLDTETTGLSGGAGTAAFLIGVGWVDGDRFRVRQYFMRDYHEEPALLEGLAEDLKPFSRVVTYNGKMFDLPLLETRYRLARQRYPLAGARHLDLLHPARRLWKARYESCRLQTLEAELLGVQRNGDVPGADIPRLYFEYVRRKDARAMAKVFRHNHIDIVSLAALALFACQWVEGGVAEDPRDLYSLGRVYERARLEDRCEEAYRLSLDGDEAPEQSPALLRLAARIKRGGDPEAAVELWVQAAETGDARALRELAIHHEHRRRDPKAALQVVERGLESLARQGLRGGPLNADFHKRRARLFEKLARSAS